MKLISSLRRFVIGSLSLLLCFFLVIFGSTAFALHFHPEMGRKMLGYVFPFLREYGQPFLFVLGLLLVMAVIIQLPMEKVMAEEGEGIYGP